jgi:membrane fusion protein (multidrug efflux system)
MMWKPALAGLVLLFVNACSRDNGDQQTIDPIALEVMTLSSQDVSIPQEYICEINAVQFVEIRARVQGYLEEIYIDEGKPVKKGQPLFRLSANEYREMVTKAEANLRRAIAEAKTKTLETDRIRLMVEKNVISPTELEVATAQTEAAESGVAEAKSTLENAKTNLGYTFIRAPFDGIVDRIPFKIGSLINTGSLLTSISNIDEVYAYFKVSETEYLQFIANDHSPTHPKKIRQPVTLQLADGSQYPTEGFVETMEGDFDRSTGSIAFRARFKNKEKILKHGSSGKILMTKQLRNAVLVPQKSAFMIQDKYFVYVLDRDNKARPKNFNTVERYKNYFIASGLKQGDRIVIEGIQQLRDGMKITPSKASDDV